MTSTALLFAYAFSAGTLGAGALHSAPWTRAAPRLAIMAWQALTTSVILAVGAGALAMTVSLPHVRDDLLGLFNLCADRLQVGYGSHGRTPAAVIGLAVFLSLTARAAWCTARIVASDRRERLSRIATLSMVALTDRLPGALVIEHAAPYAFCVGGRHRRIIVTTGLLDTLSAAELDAVLAHELAHLRQRHHLALLGCRALSATLSPAFPAFRHMMVDVRLFAELCADDSARSRVGSRPLKNALATLACAPAPTGALAASGNDVLTRLRRLDEAPRRLGYATRAAAGLGISAAVLVPLTLAAAPVVTMAWESICLLG